MMDAIIYRDGPAFMLQIWKGEKVIGSFNLLNGSNYLRDGWKLDTLWQYLHAVQATLNRLDEAWPRVLPDLRAIPQQDRKQGYDVWDMWQERFSTFRHSVGYVVPQEETAV